MWLVFYKYVYELKKKYSSKPVKEDNESGSITFQVQESMPNTITFEIKTKNEESTQQIANTPTLTHTRTPPQETNNNPPQYKCISDKGTEKTNVSKSFENFLTECRVMEALNEILLENLSENQGQGEQSGGVSLIIKNVANTIRVLFIALGWLIKFILIVPVKNVKTYIT